MYKKGKYLCSKCGKDCGNPPALKLHEAYCIGGGPKAQEDQEKSFDPNQSPGEQAPGGKKKNECTHEWRILNRDNPVEARAIEDGYLKVCEKCQELK